MEITISGVSNDTFDSGKSKFIKGSFSGGEMSKLLAVGWDSPLSPVFPINVFGDYGV